MFLYFIVDLCIMKIISKYKDFYDYLWIDGEPDVTYVRKEKLCFNYIGHILSLDSKYNIGNGSEHYGMFLGKEIGIYDIGYTFGIYPYIYCSPALLFTVPDSSRTYVHMLTKNDVDKFKKCGKDEKMTADILSGIWSLYSANEDKNLKIRFPKFSKYYWRSEYDHIKEYCWKVEMPEFFFKIKSPIFVIWADELFYDTPYSELAYMKPERENYDKIQFIDELDFISETKPSLMTNVCFNKLNYQITKYWFDEINNLNTYSSIESFLITSKLDPEPIISNDGKIIAHGFDLKTSFRKM